MKPGRTESRRRTAPLALAGALAAAWATGAPAQAPVVDSGSLSDRLARVERLLESSSLVELLDSVKTLQREVRELRGEIELQGHTVNQVKERQRDLYIDLDRRLQALEGGAPAPSPTAGAPAGPPATPPATAAAGVTPPPAQPAPPAAAPTTQAPAGAPAPAGAGTVAASAPPVAPATAPGVDAFEEQKAYQGAFDLLKAGRYDQATEAFSAFLSRYPNGAYSDNAQYWLGETYYVNRQFEPALKSFERLVADYPDSQKLTHAMLKIGYVHAELGQKEQAQRVLNELVNRYPQSTAAGLARKRLQRLRGE